MTPPNARRTLVRRGLRTIVMLGATLPGAAQAQSDVAFPKSVYVERRARLATRVEGAMVVIAGRYLINPGDALVKHVLIRSSSGYGREDGNRCRNSYHHEDALVHCFSSLNIESGNEAARVNLTRRRPPVARETFPDVRVYLS